MSNVTIGIPRGMLFYRYEKMWMSFFSYIGAEPIISGATTQTLLEKGESLAIDESCLSMKVFLGHVDQLVGKCDYLFIPRVSNLGRDREFCARFEALYDVVRHMVAEKGQKVITYNVDIKKKHDEKNAFTELGCLLGADKKTAKRAYLKAKKEAEAGFADRIEKEAEKFSGEGIKILIAAHDYVLEDAYIGRPITDFLKKNGAVSIRASVVDRDTALKLSKNISKTCKWQPNREILGGIEMMGKKVDGIILLSTFPCGPDSMVNEVLIRKLKAVPVLNVVLDGQSGVAGLETRLESFLDIIKFKRGQL